ncbi:MAG: transcription termination/antitermination factor NusG [Ignavibacteria bacterium]|nr:transcription termination/antitermination factor NusG [Ignavibacteria bacterium]
MIDKDLQNINNDPNEEDKNIQNENEGNNNLLKNTEEEVKEDNQEIQDIKNEIDDSDVTKELNTESTDKENLSVEKEEDVKEEEKNIVEEEKENITEEVEKEERENIVEEVKEDEKENITEEVEKEEKEIATEEEVEEEIKENLIEDVEEEIKENLIEDVKEEIKENLIEDVKEEIKENLIEDVKEEGSKEVIKIKKDENEEVVEVKEEVNKEVVEVKEEIKEESLSEPKEEGVIDLEKDEDKTGRFKWYAVRIISGHENKVKTYLDSQIKQEQLEDKIRNVLIPLEKVFEVKSGKKKVKKKNFLPGYILVETDLDDKIRSFISQSPSIINMVGSKSIKGQRLAPIPLRGDEIKRINAILNEDKQSEKIDLQLTVGDPVKVTSGPFNNFTGNVLDINIEKMKVKVMVSIFGRKTPIELEFTQIEKQK